MLKLWKTTPRPEDDHEELFTQRYTQLRDWSLHLTDQDRAQAEDLLHDAFIHWTFTRPNLSSIQNLEAYLYEVLRNLRLSQLRRATRNRLQQLSIFEYDLAETGLRTIDPRDQMQVQEELRHVCRYACARKETSKAGSVLILRFFHGYYPSEIAKILRSTRRSVDLRLRVARSEIKASLQHPERLRFIGESLTAKSATPDASAPTSDQLLADLLRAIFASRSGECLSQEQLSDCYRPTVTTALDCATLAHIVSCARCLDEVNKLLGLPTLSERHPINTLGPDPSKRGGPQSGGTACGGGGESVRRFRQRAKEVFEHRPQELHISVNGFILGSQKINAELNELTLDVNLSEPVSFIEVFSEQETRLLFFKVEEAPPAGPIKQAVKVSLSDERTLELALQFRSPWPVLRAVYYDPLVQPETATELDVEDEAGVAPPSPFVNTKHQNEVSVRRSPFRIWEKISDPAFWLRPWTVTVALSLLLLAAFLLLRSSAPSPVVAMELLRRASETEEAVAMKPDQVLHRTISLEERSPRGEVISRHWLELWRNGARSISALRVYDQQHQLIAGRWTSGGASRLLSRRGARLQAAPARKISASSIAFEDVWQLPPSAQVFSDLHERSERAAVAETETEYTISYGRDSADTDGLQRATLVLSRPELRAIRQTLLLRQSGEEREYVFSEASFEVRPASAVAPAVFEPDPELLRSDAATRRHGDTATVSPSPHLPTPPSLPAATAELEVEVLRQLNQANAFLGEQISVERTPEGQLHVKGIVETGERQSELLKALNAFKDNLAIKIEVLTVAEALSRQKQTPPAAVTLSRVEAAKDEIPVDAELRRYFSKKGLPSSQLDAEIRRFCDRVLSHAFQARRHALALKQIAERFSIDDLRSLQHQARADWRAMLAQHARSFQQETANLRREIESAFPPLAAASDAGLEPGSDEELVRAIGRLFARAVANDDSARRSFAIYAASQEAVPVKTPEFWRSLRAAESLAAMLVGSRQ
jgi:RNA polymerase sigma factor (sigma-70 family)